MNKKYLFCIALLVIYIVLTSFSISFGYFDDIENHWCEKQINSFCDKKIIFDDSNSFHPDEVVSKGEFCSFINKLCNYSNGNAQNIENDFNKGVEIGYMPIGSLDDTMTREEVCVILTRIPELQIDDSLNIEKDFIDIDKISPWALDSVMTMINSGTIIGYPDQSLRMKNKITKAETIMMLSRLNFESIKFIDTKSDLIVGYLIEDKDLMFKELESTINMETLQTLTFAIQMPDGYEGEDVILLVKDGNNCIELDEDFYQIYAKECGISHLIIATKDNKYTKEIEIVVK